MSKFIEQAPTPTSTPNVATIEIRTLALASPSFAKLIGKSRKIWIDVFVAALCREHPEEVPGLPSVVVYTDRQVFPCWRLMETEHIAACRVRKVLHQLAKAYNFDLPPSIQARDYVPTPSVIGLDGACPNVRRVGDSRLYAFSDFEQMLG